MMDGDWFWMLLVAFVIISMMKGGRTSRQQRKLQNRLDQLQAAPPPAPAPAPSGPTRAEVERLEQRVRVLERIVTDSGYTLASQIEALRDPHPVAVRRKAPELEENI